MSERKQENDEVSGTYPITIGGFSVNVNRKPDYNLLKLNEFHDIMPIYDGGNGNNVYLNLTNRGSGSDSTMMTLGNSVLRNLYIKGSKEMTEEEYYKIFTDTKKKDAEQLVRKIYANGFEKPSPVQTITIPEIIRGADTIVQFKSGTGKTLSFLIGTLWNFDINDDALQYIYITSSHEVATQIYKQVVDLLPKDANVSLCIGQKRQIPKLWVAFHPQLPHRH